MSIFDPVFTDAIKDVIGNEPVVDEFDNYYGASFYGTLQDSFLTGALIVRSNTNSQLVTVFEAGTRGSAFNKFDAGSQPLPSDTTPGSFEAITFPNTSDRLQPWKEKVGLTYRTTQHFDDREKYYDTCLPSLEEALAADGTKIRTKSAESLSNFLPTDIEGLAVWCRADKETWNVYLNPLEQSDPSGPGDEVRRWKDLSGNGHHFYCKPLPAFPAVGPSAPILNTSSPLNNQPALEWTSGDLALTSSYEVDPTKNPLTISVVYETSAGSSTSILISDSNFVPDDGEAFELGIINNKLGVRSIAGLFFTSTSTYGSNFAAANKAIIHTAQLSMGYAEHFLAGEISPGAAGQLHVLNGGYFSDLIDKLYLRGDRFNAQIINIAEVIIYEKKLDRYELAKLHGYLAGRYIGSGNTIAPWHLMTSGSGFSGYSFQPHGNFETDKKGFVLFNVPTSGNVETDDPSTNNLWTWSFPYEARYLPDKRVLLTSENYKNFGIKNAQYSMLPMTASTNPGLDTLPQSAKSDITGIVPLLPGNLPVEKLPSNARNAYRLRPNDASRKTEFLPAEQNYDGVCGYSFLIPSDANVVKPNSFPTGDYLSSSFKEKDLAKFFYGFGDLNTLAYYNQSMLHDDAGFKEVFNFNEYYASGSLVITGSHSSTAAVESLFAKLDNPGKQFNDQITIMLTSSYGPSVAGTLPTFCTENLGWKIKQSTNFDSEYYFSSSQLSIFTPPPGGVRWKRNGNPSTTAKIIQSQDNSSNDIYYSAIVFEITASVPWKLSYDRAISGSNDLSYFETVFMAKPGYPSKTTFSSAIPYPIIPGERHPADVDAIERIDYLTSSAKLVTLENFTSQAYLPGDYRIAFRFQSLSGSSGNKVQAAAWLDNISILAKEKLITNPDTRLIGGNNYPDFRLYSVDDRPNPHSLEDNGSYTNKLYKSNIFAVSPVIRGWKYGLVSAFPQHTRAIFKRNKFGQFRDMLEQRLFTKTVVDDTSPFGDTAVPSVSPEVLPNQSAVYVGRIDNGPVEVVFVRQRYEANERSIGKIYKEVVPPEMTTSQNLSTEVTSSLPYFDGIARHRSESSMPNLKNT